VQVVVSLDLATHIIESIPETSVLAVLLILGSTLIVGMRGFVESVTGVTRGLVPGLNR